MADKLVRLDEKLHKKLKVRAAKNDTSIRTIIEDLIKKYLKE